MGSSRVQFDPEVAYRSDSFRKQALATDLIDGGSAMIDERYAQALAACGDGGCQPRWSATENEDVSLHGMRISLDACLCR